MGHHNQLYQDNLRGVFVVIIPLARINYLDGVDRDVATTDVIAATVPALSE